MSFNVSPLNDLTIPVLIRTLGADAQSQVLYTNTSGAAPTGFLATSNGPDAVAAHTTLNFTVTYISAGVWKFFLDATALTLSRCDTYFATTPPVLIIILADGSREYYVGTYLRSRPAIAA